MEENVPLRAQKKTSFSSKGSSGEEEDLDAIRYYRGSPSYFGPVFNLINAVYGTGILGLPYAFSKSGLIVSIILSIVIGLTTVLSYYLLLWSAESSKKYSYPAIGRFAFGEFSAILIKLIFIIDLMGTLTANLLIISSCALDFLDNYVDATSPYSPFLDKNLLIGISLIFLVPLCLLPRVNLLASFSFLSMLPFAYLIILLIVQFIMKGEPTQSPVPLFGDFYGFLIALPIINYAFSSQYSYLTIYKDFKERGGTVRDMEKVGWYVLVLSSVGYLVVGIVGVMAFPKSKDTLLQNMYPGLPLDILLIALGFGTIFGYPLVVFVIREIIDSLLLYLVNLRMYCKLIKLELFSINRFILEGLGIIGFSCLIAVFVPSFITLIGLFGAVTKMIIGQILPSLFYLRVGHKNWKSDPKKWLAIILLTLGGVSGLASSIVTILKYQNVI